MMKTLHRIHSALWFVSLAAATICGQGHLPADVPSGVHARVDTSFVLFESDSLYTAWPAVARTKDGDILVMYTQTDEHMGPDGRIVGIRSSDEGRTWSSPFLVYDTPLDERECGITVLRDGRLVVHVWSTRHTEASYGAMPPGSYFESTVSAWVDHVNSEGYRKAAPLEGGHVIMSADGGRTWSKPVDGPDTIHGGIQLSDGSILVASYRTTRDYISVHNAASWKGPYRKIAEIKPPAPGDLPVPQDVEDVGAHHDSPPPNHAPDNGRANNYSPLHQPKIGGQQPSANRDIVRFGEPSILQLPSGRVLMMIRATPTPYSDVDPRSVLWETYSDDNGATWVQPYPTPLWGFPPHLLLYHDGRVIVAYGRRRPPYGQRAAVSPDGVTWRKEDEVVLRDDAPNGDLGYPASIELKDGRIFTVYYQSDPSDTLRPPQGPLPDRHKPDIWATIWQMPQK